LREARIADDETSGASAPGLDRHLRPQRFREVELTGTKFSSIVKAEALMLPIILIGGFMYWQFVWSNAPIPSSQYPFALRIWPLQASQQAIWNQINKEGGASYVLKAIQPTTIGIGAAGTSAVVAAAPRKVARSSHRGPSYAATRDTWTPERPSAPLTGTRSRNCGWSAGLSGRL